MKKIVLVVSTALLLTSSMVFAQSQGEPARAAHNEAEALGVDRVCTECERHLTPTNKNHSESQYPNQMPDGNAKDKGATGANGTL